MIRETQLSRTLRCGAKRVARPLEGSSDGRWTMIIAKIETFALRIPFKKGIKSDDRPRLRPAVAINNATQADTRETAAIFIASPNLLMI